MTRKTSFLWMICWLISACVGIALPTDTYAWAFVAVAVLGSLFFGWLPFSGVDRTVSTYAVVGTMAILLLWTAVFTLSLTARDWSMVLYSIPLVVASIITAKVEMDMRRRQDPSRG